MRPLLVKFLLLAGSFLIAFAGIEVLVRISGLTIRAKEKNDRPRAYFLPSLSNSLQGNLPLKNRDSSFLIEVVGDSFTFAPKMQFDDSFAKRLERLLNLTGGELQFVVNNRGVPGYSSPQEAAEVRSLLRGSPNLLILQITLNDPQLRPLSLEPKEVQEKFGKVPPRLLENPLIKHSEALKFIFQRLHNQRSIRAYIEYHQQLFNEPATWNRFAEALSQIKEQAEKAHVPAAAVLFPLFDFPIDQRYPFIDIHKKIKKFSKDLGLPLLDLRKSFEGINPIRLQLIPGRDSHPNEIAHRMAAERLLPWLIKNELIPLSPEAFRVFRQRDNLSEKQFDLSSIQK